MPLPRRQRLFRCRRGKKSAFLLRPGAIPPAASRLPSPCQLPRMRFRSFCAHTAKAKASTRTTTNAALLFLTALPPFPGNILFSFYHIPGRLPIRQQAQRGARCACFSAKKAVVTLQFSFSAATWGAEPPGWGCGTSSWGDGYPGCGSPPHPRSRPG